MFPYSSPMTVCALVFCLVLWVILQKNIQGVKTTQKHKKTTQKEQFWDGNPCGAGP